MLLIQLYLLPGIQVTVEIGFFLHSSHLGQVNLKLVTPYLSLHCTVGVVGIMYTDSQKAIATMKYWHMDCRKHNRIIIYRYP